MGRILDSSYNPIVTNGALEYETHSEGEIAEALISTPLINATGMNNKFDFHALRLLERGLNNNIDYSKVDRIWPMFYNGSGTMLVEMKGGASLTSSGDHTETTKGLNGGGSFYFDTAYNPSVRITDINNFSMGVAVTSDSNAGCDVGCYVTTDFFGIQSRDTGTCTMWAGSGTPVSFSNTTALGHYALNVRAGTAYGYKNQVQQDSQVVSGSLPNTNAFISSNSNNGTAVDFANRSIGFVWFYDGLLSESELGSVYAAVDKWLITQNRYYGEIA